MNDEPNATGVRPWPVAKREFYSHRLDNQMERTFASLIKMRDLAERKTRLADVPWNGGTDGWVLDVTDAAA